MSNLKSHFEQVPLETVKKILEKQLLRQEKVEETRKAEDRSEGDTEWVTES